MGSHLQGRGVKGARIALRVREDSKYRWEEAARRARRSLSDWITLACDSAASESETIVASVRLPKRKPRARRPRDDRSEA